MSKIGKKPINIPDNVEAKMSNGILEFKGTKGSLSVLVLPYIKAEMKDKILTFAQISNSKQAKSNWGTQRALTNNAIAGVTNGFEKNLEIEGIGYRASIQGGGLILDIGYSHPVKLEPPQGIKILAEKNTIKIIGVDKALVGKVAAEIRALKKPEPYKGKGIKYQGEVIRRKAGKKVAGTTA